jgi:hypothetical protein
VEGGFGELVRVADVMLSVRHPTVAGPVGLAMRRDNALSRAALGFLPGSSLRDVLSDRQKFWVRTPTQKMKMKIPVGICAAM